MCEARMQQHLPGTYAGKARDMETHPASPQFTDIPRDPPLDEMFPSTALTHIKGAGMGGLTPRLAGTCRPSAALCTMLP